jgi:hypothetical protein
MKQVAHHEHGQYESGDEKRDAEYQADTGSLSDGETEYEADNEKN